MPENQKHKFDEAVENWMAKKVVDEEYKTGKNAMSSEIADFESTIDKLEGKRNEKEYEWMSDIHIPQFASIILTQGSDWAGQYFQTRDFVEVKLEGSDPLDKFKCRAAKKCINQTLNNRKIFHYHKYIRGRTINSLAGMVYALCWWEKKIVPHKVIKEREEKLNIDVEGNLLVPGSDQVPARRIVPYEDIEYEVVKDQFNYEILDPRNVVTNNKYCYSVQEKDYVIIRDEVSYEELKLEEEKKGYFNLNLIKKFIDSQVETEAGKETYKKGETNKEPEKKVVKKFDRLLRLGKFWAVMKDGFATPGYDKDGIVIEKAQLIEAIMEFVIPQRGNTKILIRFQENPYKDSKGEPYKPLVRGWCYIHPTKDIGLSDGKYLKELQIAIDDNFNMGADRVHLSTVPTLKGKKYSLEDNTTIYFEPEHVMELEDVKDLEEFKIDANIDGTINLNTMLFGMTEKVSATSPTQMAELPRKASTTATAVGATMTSSSKRSNYKDLTYEYTFNLDHYWIILQMTYQFAEPETALKMMGEDSQYFNPDPDYTYSPLTSNIETEYRKDRKIQQIDQLIGRLVNYPNPKTVKVLNRLLAMVFEAYGQEFNEYAKYLLDENAPMPVGGKATTPANMNQMPTSNQMGTGHTESEQMARMMQGQ